jgi:hypothetical protein
MCREAAFLATFTVPIFAEIFPIVHVWLAGPSACWLPYTASTHLLHTTRIALATDIHQYCWWLHWIQSALTSANLLQVVKQLVAAAAEAAAIKAGRLAASLQGQRAVATQYELEEQKAAAAAAAQEAEATKQRATLVLTKLQPPVATAEQIQAARAELQVRDSRLQQASTVLKYRFSLQSTVLLY